MPPDDQLSRQVVVRYGTGLLTVTGDLDTDALAAAMTRRLPTGGLAAGPLRGRFDLTGATTRLLDSRILEAAVGAIDLDITRLLVGGLARFRELRQAAHRTLTDPATRETTVILLKPYPLTSAHGTEVVMHVQGRPVATFPFTLTLLLEMGETSAVVRHGAITEVVGEACSLSASFTVGNLSPPLWKGAAPKLSMHLAVRPPFDVPLAADGAPVPAPRRTTERPPVPGNGPPRR